MLRLDVLDGLHVQFECWISVDGREDVDGRVGACVLEQRGEIGGVGWTPVEGGGTRREALQLRGVVLCVQHLLDGSRVRVSERVSVIGGEEMVQDRLATEARVGEEATSIGSSAS